MNLQIDKNGLVALPLEYLDHLGWDENTFVQAVHEDGAIKLIKKTEWTVEEIQPLIEEVIDVVAKTREVHFITDDKGNRFVLAPYREELDLDNI